MKSISVGETQLNSFEKRVIGEYIEFLGETYYRITDFDGLPPFFMSLISSSDHWAFISSSGGLSAGRQNAEKALLPYYTVDKITENHENTGSKTILLVTDNGTTYLWEPFSNHYTGSYELHRSIFKNISGTSIVFEEINKSLGLRYRYAWRTGDKFGFIRSSWLASLDQTERTLEILDGIQNIIPANVTSETQNTFSNLLDAYKRCELEPESGLGIFSLSSILTDMAEPSESLLATTVGQIGLDVSGHLLSSEQLERFRFGKGIVPEHDVRGKRGAYFVHAFVTLDKNGEAAWHIIADVFQNQVSVRNLINKLKQEPQILADEIEMDIAENQKQLDLLVASADGFQHANHYPTTAHHFANVIFNIMRGGILPPQYHLEKTDFLRFLENRNSKVYQQFLTLLTNLPDQIGLDELHQFAESTGSEEVVRLCYSYLPLSFSRRHGDPSRPWNKFNIQIKNPDGSRRLDYEGNWRDIFQNWEPLAFSFPGYVEHMIATFLNATTVDGYNPYRITRGGIDWEKPDPTNPWSNIGYWSDHQIIYLQKLMEVSEHFHGDFLSGMLNRPLFSYANVPYQIKSFNELLIDPYNTIQFDWKLDKKIESAAEMLGADGKLVLKPDHSVYQVSLAEKLLSLLLAKLVNFVPEGGIWMNTQRPEWNDANNALVGRGLSVVTLAYLRRYVAFLKNLFAKGRFGTFSISAEVGLEFEAIRDVLAQFKPLLDEGFSPNQRMQVMDALGRSGSEFRWRYYKKGLSFDQDQVSVDEILAFLQLVEKYIDQSLWANRRKDHLFHSYNTLKITSQNAQVEYLYEMLEGQVAILSSGLLSADQAVDLLEALRASKLYRADQHSYILYPDRELPGFLTKNTLPTEEIDRLELAQKLMKNGDGELFEKNLEGGYHFNGSFRNITDVNNVLARLETDINYRELVKNEGELVRDLFEKTFNHDQFTGRSGTFFAYEGLGSIYWHMVSKLQLAVQEIALKYRNEAAGQRLLEIYRDVRGGLGFNKTPEAFGAFPADPYSHTPKDQGAKQPGMTGAVKEEILARFTDVGILIEDGEIVFDPHFVEEAEFVDHDSEFGYIDLKGQRQNIKLEKGSLGQTFCQVPIIISKGAEDKVYVFDADGNKSEMTGRRLGKVVSKNVFERSGKVRQISFVYKY